MKNKSLSIIIVDDEPLVRSNIRYALGKLPFESHLAGEADSGESALVLYRKLMPDVIITDVRMPHMDGLQLIESVRRSDSRTHFIIISGHADFSYAQKAMQMGVDHYVLKPVKQIDLESALKQIMLQLYPAQVGMLPESERLIAYIDGHYADSLTLDFLAVQFNFSPKYISSLVKSKLGLSFTEYLIQLRMRRAGELLRHTQLDVKQIADQVGYDDQQYFHRVFKKTTGMTPMAYRRQRSI